MKKIASFFAHLHAWYQKEKMRDDEMDALKSRINLLEDMLMDEIAGIDILPDRTDVFTEAERNSDGLAIHRRRKVLDKSRKEMLDALAGHSTC